MNGGHQLTQKFLMDLFKKDWKLYYRTPELNEKLYLHYKGKCHPLPVIIPEHS